VNPALAAFKIAGMTAVLLLAGAIIYFVGRARARRLDHDSLSGGQTQVAAASRKFRSHP
jgi:hypothetical protein